MSRYSALLAVLLILSFPVCTWLVGAGLIVSIAYETTEPRDVPFWIMAPLLFGILPTAAVWLMVLILLMFCTARRATVIRANIGPTYAINSADQIIVIAPQLEEMEPLTNEEFVERFQMPQGVLQGLKVVQGHREYLDPRKA